MCDSDAIVNDYQFDCVNQKHYVNRYRRSASILQRIRQYFLRNTKRRQFNGCCQSARHAGNGHRGAKPAYFRRALREASQRGNQPQVRQNAWSQFEGNLVKARRAFLDQRSDARQTLAERMIVAVVFGEMIQLEYCCR